MRVGIQGLFAVVFIVVATLLASTSFLSQSVADEGSDAATLVEKTLVVWAAPGNLTQRGGSALTIDEANPDAFDAVVFAERRDATWMAGSTGYKRSNLEQDGWVQETAGPDEFVEIAIVYSRDGAKGKITAYRNAERFAEYPVDALQEFDKDAVVLIGPRHIFDQRDVFVGRVREARIYAEALSADEIAALEPGRVEAPETLWARWDFANAGGVDKTGRFNEFTLFGDAKIVDGALQITRDGAFLARRRPSNALKALQSPQDQDRAVELGWSVKDPVPRQAILSSRVLREKLMADPCRPRWHFAIPEDSGMPGDPNGAFYANGRYHLMYLYNRTGSGFAWGHKTSVDLVHWRDLPDAIGPDTVGEGCFSGGAFLDDDGTAWLTFWGLGGGAGGIDLARSLDPNYERWEAPEFSRIIASTSSGVTETVGPDGKKLVLGSADPSNIWKKDGEYYVLTGNLPVLNAYGRGDDSPAETRGDRLYLFESQDLKDWRYVGIFYERNPEWTDDSEDDMCPSFLPLPSSPDGGPASGKHLLLFISHNKGCQYYVGTYDADNDRFVPEKHGRMTWVDNTFFAPEALIDGKGRQIMWAWLLDNPDDSTRGWSGVYGLPRSLWLAEDGTLGIAPVDELKALRLNAIERTATLDAGAEVAVDGVVGDSCELELTFDRPLSGKTGVKVRRAPDGEEETILYYDAGEKTLCFDSTKSGGQGRKVLEAAPLTLKEDEPLKLRVFVDKCVVEVFANDRQAITRRVYPTRDDSLGIELFAEGAEEESTDVQFKAWEIAPANPY